MKDLKYVTCTRNPFTISVCNIYQDVVLQVRNTMDSLGQKAPPKLGLGLLHMRNLLDCPRRQLLEQADHLLHPDQPPSTANTGKRDNEFIDWGYHSIQENIEWMLLRRTYGQSFE